MAAKTIQQTTTTSPENVIAQAVANIVGGRWRVESQGPRNVVFINEENKWGAMNLSIIGCLLLFFVLPGLIVLAIVAIRNPRIEGRITLTATQEGDVTTVIAQFEGKGKAKVQEFLVTLPELPSPEPPPA